jgi:hypothetical protein
MLEVHLKRLSWPCELVRHLCMFFQMEFSPQLPTNCFWRMTIFLVFLIDLDQTMASVSERFNVE